MCHQLTCSQGVKRNTNKDYKYIHTRKVNETKLAGIKLIKKSVLIAAHHLCLLVCGVTSIAADMTTPSLKAQNY